MTEDMRLRYWTSSRNTAIHAMRNAKRLRDKIFWWRVAHQAQKALNELKRTPRL